MENKENNISELTAEQQQTLITFTNFLPSQFVLKLPEIRLSMG
ncbi:hypothetical protein [Chryseobacterium sp. WG14]|nr:hypothetical protein [Chryseobacterium sp. WG14]